MVAECLCHEMCMLGPAGVVGRGGGCVSGAVGCSVVQAREGRDGGEAA